MAKSGTKPFSWVKIAVDMPWDLKTHQLETYERWVWVVILCMTRRSPKAPEIWTQELTDRGVPKEDTEFRPATVADIAKVARLQDRDFLPEYEAFFTASLREHYTRLEWLVYRAIEHFKQLLMIVENSGKTLVVKNFARRQYYEPDIPRSGQQSNRVTERQRNRGTEKQKRGKGSGRPKGDFSGAVYEVFHYWQEVMDRGRSVLSAERRGRIEARLKDGFTVDDLKLAIDGCRGSDFHMGKNERNTVYNDIELICRNASKVEQFKQRAEKKGNITYGQHGKLSNLLAGEGSRSRADDEASLRRIQELRNFGRDPLPVRPEEDPQAPPAEPGGPDPA